jgi:hypothetical protein
LAKQFQEQPYVLRLKRYIILFLPDNNKSKYKGLFIPNTTNRKSYRFISVDIAHFRGIIFKKANFGVGIIVLGRAPQTVLFQNWHNLHHNNLKETRKPVAYLQEAYPYVTSSVLLFQSRDAANAWQLNRICVA